MIQSTLSARRIGTVLSASPGGAAATIPWWLSGGVSAANAIGVYQPIGAASLAASYVNLANPGTYDAAPGVAPTWASGTGWTFNGTTQYLNSGIVLPNINNQSLIVRFSGVIGAGGILAGSNNSRYLYISPNLVSGSVYYANGGTSINVSPNLEYGVLGISGPTAYRNGLPEGSSLPDGGINGRAMYIGARNNIGVLANLFTGNIQAVAIYNATLTGPQVLAISNAMTALT